MTILLILPSYLHHQLPPFAPEISFMPKHLLTHDHKRKNMSSGKVRPTWQVKFSTRKPI